MAARQSRPKGPAWDRLDLAPVVLLLVGEPVVGDRAVARLVRAALERDRTTAVTRIDAEEYGAGTLRTLAGPSLFGEPRAIVASRLHRMNDAFLADALEYVAAPEEDVVLIARHDGGTRGRRLLDAIAEAGYQRCEIPAVKTDADKAELVRSDVAGAGRTMTRPAVEALVDALGRDVGELLAATSQLLADVDGTIDEDAVRTYYAGRVEASQFAVADAAVSGRAGRPSPGAARDRDGHSSRAHRRRPRLEAPTAGHRRGAAQPPPSRRRPGHGALAAQASPPRRGILDLGGTGRRHPRGRPGRRRSEGRLPRRPVRPRARHRARRSARAGEPAESGAASVRTAETRFAGSGRSRPRRP